MYLLIIAACLLAPIINTLAVNAVSGDNLDSLDSFHYDGRIVGGMTTSVKKHPYQVSVQLNQMHICGGAIIGRQHVLTAAHCLQEPWNLLGYNVRVGATQHERGGYLLGVQRIITHDTYSPVTHDNDIAVLVLDARLNYSPELQAVPLATARDVLTSRTRLYVSGWGLTSPEIDSGVSPVLRYVDVVFVPREQCIRAYKAVLPITARMFCAGHLEGGRDSCQGDSGGPLVGYQPGDTQGKLYGIVSWGIGCAQKGYPGVYASVASFRSWIETQLKATNN